MILAHLKKLKMIKKLFYEIDMSWKKVVIFAIAVAIYSAIVLNVPILLHSSLGHTGETFEAWILFALIIILNCKKPLEAAIKTFVFFLISQPLVYLVQVPFYETTWEIFSFYKRWFIITLLTLPGGFIAFYTKKGNILSLLIYSVANFLLMFMEFPAHFNSFISNPPYQLLACLFIIAISIMFTLLLFKDKKIMIASLALTVLFAVGGFIYENYSSNDIYASVDTTLDVSLPIEVVEAPAEIEISIDGNNVIAYAHGYGEYPITLADGDGNLIQMQVIIAKDQMSIVPID